MLTFPSDPTAREPGDRVLGTVWKKSSKGIPLAVLYSFIEA